MKVLCLLALFAVAVTAIPIEEGREHGENGWYVPQIHGSWIWIDLDEADAKLKELGMEEYGRISLTPVRYFLYTASNPSKGQKITASTQSISSSNFNPANPTRFVIHGWLAGYKSGMNKKIVNAWLSKGDYNVIVVDWARSRAIDYISSVAAVPTVGRKVAGMIDFLVTRAGMSLDTLEVIGHSLGAHVAGFAGKNVASGQIHTIVGLDPALPLYRYDLPKKRLANTDAFYVESIQTDGGQLGFLKPIGKGAFYPNGGRHQPGCKFDITGACSHNRSVNYYVEAVQKNNFPSMKCDDYQDAVKKTCGSTYSPVRMGAMTNAIMVSGDFFVPVNKKYPYGLGN